MLDRSLNTSIKNGTFDKKLVAYGKSELLLTKALIEQKSWDADKIAERQRLMADQALKVWSFPRS